MMLDLTKPIRTRGGLEVKMLTDFSSETSDKCPLRGVINGALISWHANGQFLGGCDRHEYDLVNVPERVKRTVYMRVYDSGGLGSNLCCKPCRMAGNEIGFIKVEIDAEVIPYEEDK